MPDPQTDYGNEGKKTNRDCNITHIDPLKMKFNSFGLYPSCFLKTLTKLKKCYVRHIFSCEIEHRLYNTENF